LRWLDGPSGESVAALDAYVAGCVTTFLRAGPLDARQRAIADGWGVELRRVQVQVSGDEAEYVARLVRMVELLL
jgi:hypothetical protein